MLEELNVQPNVTYPISLDVYSFESRVRQYYPTGARNDGRNRPYWDFNVRAARELELPRGMLLQMSLEVFNLLNEGTYIIYNDETEQGLVFNGINEAYRRFGRQYQLGMKLSF